MSAVSSNRSLTTTENHLVRWMLEHGSPEAKAFVAQLEKTQVTPWQCECGCASMIFSVLGHELPAAGIHPLANFTFEEDDNLSGIFVYEQNGILAGLEVYGLAGEAPKSLPSVESLRPFQSATRQPITNHVNPPQ